MCVICWDVVVYVLYMSIFYGDLMEEDKKKVLEKVFMFDLSLDGLNFWIN